MEVVSSSASDTVAGAGMRSVSITYLDANWESKSVVLAMNGTTPVPMPETVRAINLMVRGTTGTFGGANIGNVSIRATGGLGATYAYMRAGIGVAQQALYTVPAGATMYLEGVTYSINRTATGDRWADVAINSVGSTGAFLHGSPVSISSAVPHRAGGGVALAIVPEKTSIWASCEAVSGNNTNLTVALYGWRINNTRLQLKG